MQIIIKVLASFFLIMSAFWVLLPCVFGLQNYVKSHNKYYGFIARFCWLALLLVHPVLLYAIWFHDMTYWYLLLLMGGHIFFLRLFGRDLGSH